MVDEAPIKPEEATSKAPFRHRWQRKMYSQAATKSGNKDHERAYLARPEVKKIADTSSQAGKVRQAFDEDSDDEVEQGYHRSYFGGKTLSGLTAVARQYDNGEDEEEDGNWSEKEEEEDADYMEGSERLQSVQHKKSDKKKSTKNTAKKISKKPTSRGGKGVVGGDETDEISRPISMNGRVSGRQLVLWHRELTSDETPDT